MLTLTEADQGIRERDTFTGLPEGSQYIIKKRLSTLILDL